MVKLVGIQFSVRICVGYCFGVKMRCCVPACKNDSRHSSKSQGITFHAFPNEPEARSTWLRAVGKVGWQPRERSAVCSQHFLRHDLYETRSGLRKVRVGAVPIMTQDKSSCDNSEPADLKVCRICLAANRELYPIAKYEMAEAYEHLTGISVRAEDGLPQCVCAWCARRLAGGRRLRRQALRAHDLMVLLLAKQHEITMQNLKTIDREHNQLTSGLAPRHYPPNHCDLTVDHIDTTDMHEVNLDVVIKNEDSNEIFFNEADDFTQDSVKDEGVREEGLDCGLSDKGFSTDDSIPLELSRTKKKTKVKTKKTRKVKLKTKAPVEPKIDRRRKPFLNDELNETLFTITDLTFEEQLAEINKRQESSNYKNSVFKCTECFKGFLDEDAYHSHMTRHTDQCGEHQCDICKTHFKHPHALRKHITAHHTQRFSCNQCPYVTTHRQTARLHERWHKGTKYHCPHCQDEFVKFTTYMGHIRIKHPSDFVCQLCGYSFVSEKGIELHKKLKHRLESVEVPADGPLCEQCDVRFVSADALRQHRRVSARHDAADKDCRESNKPKKGRKSKETKEREKKAREKSCKELGDKRRVYPSQMRKAEGPIPCEQCGLQLEDSRAYHGHFRRMHPDKNRTNYPSMKSPCMCEVCGRMFQSYALLKDHTWVHTGERPFKCDACGKAFRMKQRLVAHRRVHAMQKASYLCNQCGKHFSTHSNRQRHMFIHTGLKPFTCEMCGKGFKHASEKRAHVTYVHLKKPWPKRARGKRRDPRDTRDPPDDMPQEMAGGSATERPRPPPPWACAPKLDHLAAQALHDKPVYYNLKI